jgi:glycosyltransferase involved in cell wall biosynthesis
MCDGYTLHVTVLIPVYNREYFIEDAIDSVIVQDYHDWDVLVVDDGSTDRTADVVKSRMSDDRIQLIQMKHSGLTAATAMGIEHARGPVVTNLDSDDKLMPDSLSTVMPKFETNPRLGYVWTNWVDSTGDKGTSDFVPYGKTLVEAIISGWWPGSAQLFFRKEFYLQSEGLDTSIKYAEDVQLALLIGKTGCDTLHIPKVTYWRRIHPHQITVERYTAVVEDERLVRRKFSSGSAALIDLYFVGLEKENDALRNELNGIRRCFGYRVMKLYGSIIDGALPDDTRRGKLKKKIIDRIRNS